MKQTQSDSRLVYSTTGGTICLSCGKPHKECICKTLASRKIAAGDGIVRIRRETKGRSGKGVTVITGLPLTAGQLDDLAKLLKQKCGCGGTVKEGTIEIQGDKRELLLMELTRRGFTVKLAGG